MKKIILPVFSLFLLGIFSAFTPAQAPSVAKVWKIDASHSSVNFSVRHFFSDVTGTFDEFRGDFQFDPENLKESNINISVNVGSVNTKNEKRDGHLQSPDFFNAEKWSTMNFKSTAFKAGDEKGSYLVAGEMTIRDVTKTVEVPVKFLGAMDHPWQEDTKVAGFSAEFSIDRNDYGVGTGDWAATAVIGDEVKVTINMEVNAGA